jgi:hypothetical protein
VQIASLLARQKDLEDRVRSNESQLADGRADFRIINSNVKTIMDTMSLMALKIDAVVSEKGIKWGEEIAKAGIFWAVPILGGALLWLIQASGHIAKVVPQ